MFIFHDDLIFSGIWYDILERVSTLAVICNVSMSRVFYQPFHSPQCQYSAPGGGFLKHISDTKICYSRSFQNTCVNRLQLQC